MQQPAFYIPHGGGPCFFMDDPQRIWTGMGDFLRSLPRQLSAAPTAILLVSAHWETDGFAFTGAQRPSLIFDYYGFPPHTYQLRWEAPGAPDVARKAASLLTGAGLAARVDASRGLDHGVFVPMMLAFPDADVPVVEMSVERGLDPSLHLAAGRALTPLRDAGVLIIASGMSFHNMRAYGDPRFSAPSEAFDAWLSDAIAQPAQSRATLLADWEAAPFARLCHPEEEHLIPLMVAAGAATAPGRSIYRERVLETAISAFRFD